MEGFKMLPLLPWKNNDKALKALGEYQNVGIIDIDFLTEIKLITIKKKPELTPDGIAYFEQRFIKGDIVAANKILVNTLLKFPPTQAIMQLLGGVKGATRDNVLSILKSRKFWLAHKDETPLTNFLLLLNSVGLLTYSKKNRSVRVTYETEQSENNIPQTIFIDRPIPYSNIIHTVKILKSCNGYIHWIDKHFTFKGLEWIWEAADANKIKEIKILSLQPRQDILEISKDRYHRLRTELSEKGIVLQWFIVDSKLIHDSHDRWMLASNKAWNTPDVNTISSGNMSEISQSPNHDNIEGAFRKYWAQANDLLG